MPLLPWQYAAAIALFSVVWATALVAQDPPPAPPLALHVAFADASLPPVTLCAALLA